MPLSQDQIRALQTRVVLPPGSVPGTRLTWLGPTDADVDWTSEPDQQIRDFTGDPNGVVFAPKGTLGVERNIPTLWINDDGQAAWSAVGGGGFPITFDDGSNTYTIDINSFALRLIAVEDGAPTRFADILIDNGDVDINCKGTNGFYVLNADQNITMTAQSGASLTAVGSDLSLSAGAQLVLSGTTRARISGPELIFSGATAAPASGDLSASEFALWLDDTPGATKLMIKGKDSGGTVRTGSVVLT